MYKLKLFLGFLITFVFTSLDIQASIYNDINKEEKEKLEALKTRELEQLFVPEVELKFQSVTPKKPQYNGFVTKSKKNTNLFEYGCNGIKYTGAIEQGLIDDVLEIKKEIKAMFDPITKMTKLDAILFSIGLIKCTFSEMQQYFTGSGTNVVSGKKVSQKRNFVQSAGSILAYTKNRLLLNFDVIVGQGGAKKGMATESNLDFSGFLKSVWDNMDESETFEQIFQCVLKNRNEILKTLYRYLTWNFKLDLELKTMLGAQCSYNLRGYGAEKKTFDELFGGALSDFTSDMINSVYSGSEIDTVEDAAKRTAILKEINSSLQNNNNNSESVSHKNVSTSNFHVESNINYKENAHLIGQELTNCGAVSYNTNGGFSRSCEDINGTSINVPIKVKRNFGNMVANNIFGKDTTKYGENKKTSPLTIDNSLDRPGRTKNAYNGVDENGQPVDTHEEKSIKAKLMGSKNTVQVEKFIYKEGGLSKSEIIKELKASGLLYKPTITAISNGQIVKTPTNLQPTYLSNVLKNLNLFTEEEKIIITDYLFRKKEMFTNNVDISVYIPKHTLNQAGDTVNSPNSNWMFSRRLDKGSDFKLKFQSNTVNSVSNLLNPNMLRDNGIIVGNTVYSPENDFTEDLTTLYITKCNKSQKVMTQNNFNRMMKLFNYYNQKYVPNVGLEALFLLFSEGISKEVYENKYKIIKDQKERDLQWVSETHLQYLLYKKNEIFALISMIQGLACDLTKEAAETADDAANENLEDGQTPIKTVSHQEIIETELTKFNTNSSEENIWSNHDVSIYGDNNLETKLMFSRETKLLNTEGNVIFNNKINYYDGITSLQYVGGKSIKNKIKIILKELERKILDAYTLEENVRDINEMTKNKEANSSSIMTIRNIIAVDVREEMELEKIKYLNNMGKYFR
jgi:hypothetical protein